MPSLLLVASCYHIEVINRKYCSHIRIHGSTINNHVHLRPELSNKSRIDVYRGETDKVLGVESAVKWVTSCCHSDSVNTIMCFNNCSNLAVNATGEDVISKGSEYFSIFWEIDGCFVSLWRIPSLFELITTKFMLYYCSIY